MSSLQMLSMEKLANATIKNRAEYSQMSIEINRIEKEKRDEMKMLSTEQQRFKAKYSKSNFDGESSEKCNPKTRLHKSLRVNFLVQGQPHLPFKAVCGQGRIVVAASLICRRNGEHRVPQVSSSVAPVDFKHLQFLLFTNGEVDIEKVLCLHLISLHETKHLTPPKRPYSCNILKKDSPLEQLIERSKDNQIEATSSTCLPTYILDVNPTKVYPSLQSDDRLSTRLLINEKILELITTVITTLEKSNPEKFQNMKDLAEDPSALKRIFRKEHIQNFLMTLKEFSIIKSSGSFILTQPPKANPNHIEIRTATGALEDLVKFIRANVLQFPKRHNWRSLEEDAKEILMNSNPFTLQKKTEVKKLSSAPSKPPETKIEPTDEEIEREEVEINPFRRTIKNFVAENIAAVANFGKLQEKPAPKIKHIYVNQEAKKKSFRSNKKQEITLEPMGSTRRKSETSDEIKVHSKQTTCPACMEKWKTPLPAPKVSTVLTKNNLTTSMHNFTNKPVLKTNSLQRVAMLIAQEQYKLNSYDRKFSNSSSKSSVSQWRKKMDVKSTGSDLIDLDLFDLEKIRQEIREKETKKKLEKFLSS